MTAPMVPTLSDKGWVKTTNEKIDFLVSHFLEAFVGYNIQTSIMRHGEDIDSLLSELNRNMSTYLNRYFEDVELSFRQDPKTPEGAINIILSCVVVDNGKTHSLGLTLQSSGSRFKIIQTINNYGQ